MIYLLDNRGQRYVPENWEDHEAVSKMIMSLLTDGAKYVDQVAVNDYTMRQRYSVLDRDKDGRPNNYVVEAFNGEIVLIPNEDESEPMEPGN